MAILEAQLGAGALVSGFGLCLFLALLFLLKWQYRKHIMAKRRVRRGLRGYVSNHGDESDTQEASAPAQR